MSVSRTRAPFGRILVLSLGLAACTKNEPARTYGFLALLGRDTVSLERVTRTADTVVSDEVDRFPRVRRRHTRIILGDGGRINHLEMDIRTPSEAGPLQQRYVTVDVTDDSVKITKKDAGGTKAISFATGGELSMAHLPQMYGLTDLYFSAALARAASEKLATGDSVILRQFYIDREFDNFPLHSGVVKLTGPGTAELSHDWLSGSADATFDSANHMLTYSGERSTYKVQVKRLAEQPDVERVFGAFAALEMSSGGMRQLSVRDTARATIGTAIFSVDYGRPLARGRVLLGNLLPYNFVWRTGANAATQFSTSAPMTLAGLRLPAGTYTLWTVPREKGADIVVNKQTGQWGTSYDDTFDVGMAHMQTETAATPVEKFTISIVPIDSRRGTLVMAWGTFKWSAAIETTRGGNN